MQAAFTQMYQDYFSSHSFRAKGCILLLRWGNRLTKNLHLVTRAESGATPPSALLALPLSAWPLLFTLAKLAELAAAGYLQNTPLFFRFYFFASFYVPLFDFSGKLITGFSPALQEFYLKSDLVHKGEEFTQFDGQHIRAIGHLF